MRTHALVLASFLFSAAGAPLFAFQGSDACANATPIAGNGPFPFDLTAATTGPEGQNEALCQGTGGPRIHFDVWYAWTATSSGPVTADTCGQTTIDTKIAVYPGPSCPQTDGTALDCNDDTCATQSELGWNAVAGSTYLIQIGVWPNAQPGTGTFKITAGSGPTGTPYCFCTGSGPCGNNGGPGNGCANGTFATGANLDATGTPAVGGDTLVLNVTQATPNRPGLFFQGLNATNGGNGLAFGDGLRCAGGGIVRLEVVFADSQGMAQTSVSISVEGGVLPGDLRRYQYWYRDPTLSPCGAGFNLTNGYAVNWF